MPRPPALDADTIASQLPTGWTHDGAWIRRTFKFADFSEAFGFMSRVALAAEKLNHHPNWSNVWATVEVSLQTHDAGGITELDLKLAAAMNKCSGQ